MLPDNTRDPKPGKESRREQGDLPGYPHYPPSDDIMNPQNGMHKVNADDQLANSPRLSRDSIRNLQEVRSPEQEDDDDLGIVSGTEADVTNDDLALLGKRDEDMDMGDDELIRARSRVDESENEQDLDVPGAELDDRDEEIGEEDEENNYYSLGGDRHETLEEDPS